MLTGPYQTARSSSPQPLAFRGHRGKAFCELQRGPPPPKSAAYHGGGRQLPFTKSWISRASGNRWLQKKPGPQTDPGLLAWVADRLRDATHRDKGATPDA